MIKGVGYTGADALYNMLADTYVVPVRGLQGKQRFFNVLKLFNHCYVFFCDAVYLMQHEKVTEDERRVLKLVMQTPLSVAELIRCFENSVRDVSVFCQVKIPGFAKANSLVLPREFPGNCQINSLVLPRYFTRMRALRRR